MSTDNLSFLHSRLKPALLGGLLLASIAPHSSAHAQIKVTEGAYSLSTEAWLNATGGGGFPDDNQRDGARGHIFSDAAIRSRASYAISPDTAASARVVLTSNSDIDEAFRVNQLTAIYQSPWGRLEFGRRQGLPDLLGVYESNPYTYTTAEFGPASGISLDPDGGLPTRFLAPSLSAQINALSYLGNTPALASDRAIKGLYVSPDMNGYSFGVAYTPNAGSAPVGRGRNFSDLLQSGINYEVHSGKNLYRIGTSYTFATGNRRNNTQYKDLHSISAGASATFDSLIEEDSSTIIGVNISSDADTGIAQGGFHSSAIGITTSANYEIGPWTYGGYYQYATAEGNITEAGNDRLHVFEIGTSYRFSPQLALYHATYLYHFTNEDNAIPDNIYDGAVLLAGFRVNL